MRFKGVGAACAVAVCCAGGLWAQNARVDAMGGVLPVIDDMIDIADNPAYANNYEEALQATISPGVGPLVGVKEASDMMCAGLYYDANRVLDDDVYTYLLNTVLTGGGSSITSPVAADVDPIPHVLLGLDLDAAKFGLDLFWERAFYRSKVEDEAAGVTTTTEMSGTFSHLGFVAGMLLDSDLIPMAATLAFGLPRMSGNFSGATEQDAKTENGLSLDASYEVFPELLYLDWTAGIAAGMLMYQGSFESAGTSTKYSAHRVISTELYGGFEKQLDPGVLLATYGYLSFANDLTEPDNITAATYNADGGNNTSINTVGWGISAGLEKTWDDLKRFDEVQGRCGLTYAAVDTIERNDGAAGGNSYESREKRPTARGGFNATLGGGFGKGMFQFDLQLSPTALVNTFKLINGTSTTNDMVKVTATFDFNKLGGGGGGTDFSTPSYTPAPEPSFTPASEETEETESEDDEGFSF